MTRESAAGGGKEIRMTRRGGHRREALRRVARLRERNKEEERKGRRGGWNGEGEKEKTEAVTPVG